jgi:hypothetical protein
VAEPADAMIVNRPSATAAPEMPARVSNPCRFMGISLLLAQRYAGEAESLVFAHAGS